MLMHYRSGDDLSRFRKSERDVTFVMISQTQSQVICTHNCCNYGPESKVTFKLVVMIQLLE